MGRSYLPQKATTRSQPNIHKAPTSATSTTESLLIFDQMTPLPRCISFMMTTMTTLKSGLSQFKFSTGLSLELWLLMWSIAEFIFYSQGKSFTPITLTLWLSSLPMTTSSSLLPLASVLSSTIEMAFYM